MPMKKRESHEPLAKFFENDAWHVPVKCCSGDFGGVNPVLIHFH